MTECRGERHHSARLTPEMVRWLRQQHSAGHSVYRLAKANGIPQRTAYDAVHRRTWKHI